MCGGEIRVGMFLLCIPLRRITRCFVNDTQHCPHSLSQDKDRLSVWSQDTLLLKGTKHQLSIYDKMPIVNVFSKVCVTFQFSFWSITGVFEK